VMTISDLAAFIRSKLLKIRQNTPKNPKKPGL